jgi:PAS domain S-box-containing protein
MIVIARLELQTRAANCRVLPGGSAATWPDARPGVVALSWRPRAMAVYTAWILMLAAAYAAFPGLRAPAWALIGVSGATALAAGVALHRPARGEPWLLLAGACACLAASQTAFLIASGAPRASVPSPWIADSLALAACPLTVTGLVIFLRWRTAGRAGQAVLDALALAAGCAFACLLLLVFAGGTGAVTANRAFAAAFPLCDVLILAVAARLVAARPIPARPAWLLAVGAAGLGVSDLAYALGQLHGGPGAALPVPVGWMLCFWAWGAAALDPAMTVLTVPVPGRPVGTGVSRLTLLALAALAVPGALAALAAQDRHAGAGLLALGAGAFDLIVLACLAAAVISYRRALGRERALRLATTAFAAAATIEDVAAAAQAAVSAVAGRHPLQALLARRAGATLVPVLPAPGGGPGGGSGGERAGSPVLAGRHEAVMSAWLAPATPPCPVLLPADPDDGTAAAWDDGVLLCPLPVRDEPPVGVLAVFGEPPRLAARAGTLEVIAGQAAHAADQVMRSAEARREASRAYVRAVAQDSSDAVLIVSGDGVVDYATPAAERFFGTAHVAGTRLTSLVSPGERETVARAFARMRDGADATMPGDWLVSRPDGTPAEVRVSYRDLRGDRMIAGLVLTLHDVSEQRSLQRELTHRSFHDALTGLPNRSLFTDRITRALARPRRAGTALAVLVVDLDDLNMVNDSMGHTVGDELLVAAAGRLTALARGGDPPEPPEGVDDAWAARGQASSRVLARGGTPPSRGQAPGPHGPEPPGGVLGRGQDTAARIGADEFALLIEEADGDAAVERYAQEIVEAFAEPFVLTSGPVIATATVGVATTEDSTDSGDLVRHADLALYAAKAAGKRQWRRYQPVLSAGLIRRRELQGALEEAVADSAFTLAYQPIVELTSGELAGFEALVRWPHPQWGMMQPDQFISLAEETGQIVPLGSWVLSRAAADLARWRQEPRGLYVSVNVSARQFSAPGFVDGVRRVLAASGLEPAALTLELTESVLLRRDERMHADLAELKAIGVRLAIDDFGTGYSSLSYLRELPIDVLKMDKSFVDGIAVSDQRLALAEGIVQIARTLRLEVIAEGIESEIQRDLLTSMGCQFGQGYLLAMPMPAGQAETLVRVGSHLVPSLPRQAKTGMSPDPR